MHRFLHRFCVHHIHVFIFCPFSVTFAPFSHLAVNNTVGGWFSSLTQSMSLDDDSMSAELKMFNKLEQEAEKLEKSSALTKVPSEEDIDHTGVCCVCDLV